MGSWGIGVDGILGVDGAAVGVDVGVDVDVDIDVDVDVDAGVGTGTWACMDAEVECVGMATVAVMVAVADMMTVVWVVLRPTGKSCRSTEAMIPEGATSDG
jgi:hypothetical protein